MSAAPTQHPVGKKSAGASPSSQRYLTAEREAERRASYRRSGARVDATGWISVVDDIPENKGRYLLHTAGGRTLRIKLAKDVAITFTGKTAGRTALSTGDIVDLDGTGSATVTATALTVSDRLPQPTLRAIENVNDRAIQNRSVLVVPITFADLAVAPPVTTTALADEFFGTATTKRSVKNFYDRSSRGRMAITGLVTGWTELPSYVGCNWYDWYDQAADKLRTAGFEPDDYDQVQLVPTWSSAVEAECVEAFGSFRGVSWSPHANLTWANVNNGPFLTGTAAHEMGHSFGLGHSNTVNCDRNGLPAPITTTTESDLYGYWCEEDDNGGDVDVMGGSFVFRPFQAYQRARLGLLPGDRITDITADGVTRTLTRESTSGVGTGTQLLRLRRPTSQPETRRAFYYLEYRAALPPFDRYPAGDPSLAGVTIHTATDHRGDAANVRGEDSPVRISPTVGSFGKGSSRQFRPAVDNVPENGDTVLRAGDSMYDPSENLTITVVSVSATDAQVRVSSGTPVAANPSYVYVQSGRLNVWSPPGQRNRFNLAKAGSDVVVSDFGAVLTPSTGCRSINTYTVACARAALPTETYVTLGDGDDTLWVDQGYPGTVTVDPGTGDDALTFGTGNARVIAGASADGRDTFASRGNIVLDYGARSSDITATTSTPNGSITIGSESDMLVNSAGTSVLDPYRFTSAALITGSGIDRFTISATNPLRLEGGAGADTFLSTGANVQIIATDGVADAVISCGGATLVRDTSDPAPAGCASSPTGPQARIVTGPVSAANVGAIPSLSFVASPSSGTTFRCKTVAGTSSTGGTWSTCTSPHTPTIPTDGTYTFAVQAMNGATVGGVEETRTFTVDRAAPSESFTPIVDSYDSFIGRLLGVTVGAQPTYDCAFAGGAWTPCTTDNSLFLDSPVVSTSLALRAVDEAGNPSATTSGSTTLAALPMKPFAHITSGPSSKTTQTTTSATLGFGSTVAGSTFECRLDGAAWAACTGPKAYTGLANGTHVFEVRASKGGLTGPPVSRTFDVQAGASILTPLVVPLSGSVDLSSGTKSWIRWKGTANTAYDRSAGQLRMSTWSPLGAFTPSLQSGASFTWTNALGASPIGGTSTGDTSGVGASGPGTGFRFTVPAASSETRMLKLYVGLRGVATAGQVRVSWAGGPVTTIPLSSPSTDFQILRSAVWLSYRPSKATDTLTVDFVQSGGAAVSTNNVRLYAATVS